MMVRFSVGALEWNFTTSLTDSFPDGDSILLLDSNEADFLTASATGIFPGRGGNGDFGGPMLLFRRTRRF